MKCTGCKFYQKSKMFGNHCICTGTKPCEVKRHKKIHEHHKKQNKKRSLKYGYGKDFDEEEQ